MDLRDKVKETKRTQEEIKERVAEESLRPSDTEREQADSVIQTIADEIANELFDSGFTGDNVSDERLSQKIHEECDKMDVPFENRARIEKIVSSTILGTGPIEEYMQDPDVTEIVVQRFDNVVYEKSGIVYESDVVFNDEKHLQTIINRIVQRVGRQINLMTPIVDARLQDGSRVNATIPPVTPYGATLTIRKFNHSVLSPKDYLNFGSASERMLYFLALCVQGKANIFVSGGTGTGKTTLLNMLSRHIPENELILTIEDTLELQLQQKNVRREEVRLSSSSDMMMVDQKQLVKSALRQRPDRIVLGEIRDGSVVELISAASTGHDGTMTTIHANSPRNMCDIRIPILFSMNKDVSFSEKSIAMQISESVQVVVQISRLSDGTRKITEIAEVSGVGSDDKVILNTIFYYDRTAEEFKATGYIPKSTMRKAKEYGIDIPDNMFQEKE